VKPKPSQPKPAAAKPEEAIDDDVKAGPSNQPAQDESTYALVVKPKRQKKAAYTATVQFSCVSFILFCVT